MARNFHHKSDSYIYKA